MRYRIASDNHHLHPEQHSAIGKVKDMAVGMGLIMSVAAVPARDRRSILGRLVGMAFFLDQMRKRDGSIL